MDALVQVFVAAFCGCGHSTQGRIFHSHRRVELSRTDVCVCIFSQLVRPQYPCTLDLEALLDVGVTCSEILQDKEDYKGLIWRLIA